jgi:hypothetical protein
LHVSSAWIFLTWRDAKGKRSVRHRIPVHESQGEVLASLPSVERYSTVTRAVAGNQRQGARASEYAVVHAAIAGLALTKL